MSTDIAIPTGGTDLAASGSPADALDRLGRWVEAARQAHQLVAPLVTTAFVPESYKARVDPRATDKEKQQAYDVAVANATAAVLQGITLGLDPLTSLQQIYIVHGRPGMYAALMVALVKSRGHQVWTEDLTDNRAVVCGRRRGDDLVERRIVTMDMARKAGWTSNPAYAKTPQDMLYARAATRVCKAIAPEVLMGIASIEEIQDEMAGRNGAGTRTIRPPKAARAQATALPAAPEPPLEAEPIATTPEPESAQEPPATPAQTRKLYALLRANELGDKADALGYIGGVIGRDVTSTKELTKAEAGLVIDRLEALEDQPAEPPLTEEPAAEAWSDVDVAQPPLGGDQ